MLNPKYLQDVTNGLEDMFYDLETQILMDIAERIRLNANQMTATANYELYRISSLGVNDDRINSYLSKALNISKKEVNTIISESSFKSIENDNLIFKEAFDNGIITSFKYNRENFKELIIAGVAAMQNELTNICNTTAITSQNKLTSALNDAYLQISSGAFSSDQVVDNIVKQLSKDGLGIIEYKSGAKRQLDTTVRTALRSSVNQTACKCQELNLDEMECNLVEVTSHLGARPEHAEWQGKIYWRIEPYKNYKNFKEATRYGYGDGLGGWNCRHSFYPYFPGISEKSFEHYNVKENNELYELQQEQRYNERMIRGWERRKKVVESAGLDSSKETSKVREWKNKLNKLLDSHGNLKHNYSREKIVPTKFLDSDIAKAKKEWIKSAYQTAISRGSISPLVKFETYENISKRIDNELIGLELSKGITIKKYSKHLVDRIIGQYESSNEPLKNKRQGVNFDSLLECLKNPMKIGKIEEDELGRKSIKFYGNNCSVSINPITNEIIQVNPRKR